MCAALARAQGTLQVLRAYGREHVVPLIHAAGLVRCARTLFFVPLAQHMVTRVDVVCRSQLLSMARTLLFARTDGASDAPSLALVFIFCDASVEEITGVLKSDGDVELDSALGAQHWDPADVEEARVGDDAADDDATNNRSNEVLWKAARGEFQKLSPAAQKCVQDGGAALHREFANVRKMLQPAHQHGHVSEPFALWETLRDGWALGAPASREQVSAPPVRKPREDPPADTGPGKRTRTASSRLQDIGAREPKKPAVDPAAQKEQERAAKLAKRLVHPARSNIAYVRETLLRMVLAVLPMCAGLRLAQLPTKAMPVHVCRAYFGASGIKGLRAFLAGPNVDKSLITLSGLFNVPDTVSSIMFGGGRTFSTFTDKAEKVTVTSTLMADAQRGQVKLDTIYGAPQDRAVKRDAAQRKAATRQAKGKPTARVPVSKLRGRLTEKRFRSFVDAGAGKSALENPLPPPPPPPPPADPPEPPKPQFNIKFATVGALHPHWQPKLDWLKQRLIVALDPGQRWVVSGVVVRLASYTVVEGKTGDEDTAPVPPTVSLEFEYQRLRISGRRWQTYRFDESGPPVSEDVVSAMRQAVESALSADEGSAPAGPAEGIKRDMSGQGAAGPNAREELNPAAHAEREASGARPAVESIVADLAGEEFLLAEPAARIRHIKNLLVSPNADAGAAAAAAANNESVRAKLDAAVRDMLDEERVQRKDARVRHRKQLALQLVRHIDQLGRRCARASACCVCAAHSTLQLRPRRRPDCAAGRCGRWRRPRARTGQPPGPRGHAGGLLQRHSHRRVQHFALHHVLPHARARTEHQGPLARVQALRGAGGPREAGRRAPHRLVGPRHGRGLVSSGRCARALSSQTAARRNFVTIYISLLLTGQRPAAMTRAGKTGEP